MKKKFKHDKFLVFQLKKKILKIRIFDLQSLLNMNKLLVICAKLKCCITEEAES